MEPELQAHGGLEGAEHGRGAAHVALHAGHVVLALHRQAACVVDDALSDPGHLHRGAGGLVLEHDEGGQVLCGLPDTPEPAQSGLSQGLAFDDTDGRAGALGDRLGLFDEGPSAELAGGSIHEASGQAHTLDRRLDSPVFDQVPGAHIERRHGDGLVLVLAASSVVLRERSGGGDGEREGVALVVDREEDGGVSAAAGRLGEVGHGPAARRGVVA